MSFFLNVLPALLREFTLFFKKYADLLSDLFRDVMTESFKDESLF